MRSRRHVRQPQRRRLAGGLGGGAEGGVAARQLPVGPPVARGEVQEGQHQLGGVAVAVPLRAASPLVPPVGCYDLGQRQAEHLGRHLCVGAGSGAGHMTGFKPTAFGEASPPTVLRRRPTAAASLIWRAKCPKTDLIHAAHIRSNS